MDVWLISVICQLVFRLQLDPWLLLWCKTIIECPWRFIFIVDYFKCAIANRILSFDFCWNIKLMKTYLQNNWGHFLNVIFYKFKLYARIFSIFNVHCLILFALHETKHQQTFIYGTCIYQQNAKYTWYILFIKYYHNFNVMFLTYRHFTFSFLV